MPLYCRYKCGEAKKEKRIIARLFEGLECRILFSDFSETIIQRKMGFVRKLRDPNQLPLSQISACTA
jgi:hypothetical protein